MIVTYSKGFPLVVGLTRFPLAREWLKWCVEFLNLGEWLACGIKSQMLAFKTHRVTLLFLRKFVLLKDEVFSMVKVLKAYAELNRHFFDSFFVKKLQCPQSIFRHKAFCNGRAGIYVSLSWKNLLHKWLRAW